MENKEISIAPGNTEQAQTESIDQSCASDVKGTALIVSENRDMEKTDIMISDREGADSTGNKVNLDEIVDYKAEYSSVIKKAVIHGNELIGLCPFHDDHNPSFSANLKTGQWQCYADGSSGNFISFYAKLNGISNQEAYKEILGKYGYSYKEEKHKEPKDDLKPYTLEEYASEKKLPIDWLRKVFGLKNEKDWHGIEYLRFPYYREDGLEATHRKRYADKEFRWKQGSAGHLLLYGLWRMKEIQEKEYAVLVEGESDTQSLWCMGIPALGVPGAGVFKAYMADVLQGLTIYLHIEPGNSGTTFFKRVTDELWKAGFNGKIHKFSCSTIDDIKDPNDLYMKHGREDGAKMIVQLIKEAEPINLAKMNGASIAVKDAPVDLKQPEGWYLSDNGIFRIVIQNKNNQDEECQDKKDLELILVCITPIILTRRLHSIETGEEKIEIAFKRDGKWTRAVFRRSEIFTSRNIIALADLGCTITSENARKVVQFLSALEAENIDVIEKVDSTNTFGWKPGCRFIPGREGGIVLDIDPSQRNLQAALCRNGTLDGWIETMEPHRKRSKFRFILATGFAPPLLRILKLRDFFVYIWGDSRSGKTAGIKTGLSPWGDPNGLMVNFNATQVGLERTAGVFCDLPLGIDERQLAGKGQETLEKIIYMLSSGTGRTRGAKNGGVQATLNWNTIVLASGEQPLSTESSQTGVSTRTIQILDGPFEDEKSASLMHDESVENCGWAGPEFIKHLVSVKGEEIKKKYDEMFGYVNSISEQTPGSHVAGIAVIALADAMLDTWLFKGQEAKGLQIDPESWEDAKKMAETIINEQMSIESGDVNEHAVQFVVDWINSNRSYFGPDVYGARYGWINESENIIYIIPNMLTEALTKRGFDPEKTKRYMADQGLIKTEERSDHPGRLYSVVRKFKDEDPSKPAKAKRVIEFYLGKYMQEHEGECMDDNEAKQPDKNSPAYQQESFVSFYQNSRPSAEAFTPLTTDDVGRLPF